VLRSTGTLGRCCQLQLLEFVDSWAVLLCGLCRRELSALSAVWRMACPCLMNGQRCIGWIPHPCLYMLHLVADVDVHVRVSVWC